MKTTLLPLPKSGSLTHLIHLSDIHIRTGDPIKSRYNEYITVFDNLFKQINNIQYVIDQTTSIVITGDIFETKNRIESPGIKLFNFLIHGLSDIAPVYLIQGNHDYRQDQPDSPDMISSLLYQNINTNVHYLSETGCYTAGQIGFSLVSCKDTLIPGNTSGQTEQLPPFPNNFPPEIKTKIALFHGTVIGSTLQNYSKSPHGYPIEWFNGFDLGLFGDIHLQQIHNVTPNNEWIKGAMPWAYSSSLIQQTFGEPIFGHGILVWDLINKQVTPYHINNSYGFIYLKKQKTGWAGFDSKWIPLETLLNDTYFPTNILCKIKGASKHDDINQLQTLLQSYNIKQYKIISNLLNDTDSPEDIDPEHILTEENITINNFNSAETWIQYINESHTKEKLTGVDWINWFKHPQTLVIPGGSVLPEFNDKILERNTRIIKLANNLQDELNLHQIKISGSFLKLNLIQWQWILCYKNDNWFNFNDMSRKVCTINAKNDSGKSSFLEIICLVLFGESIPSRQNKENSASIICNQKPPTEIASIKLDFSVGDKSYQLYRTFEKRAENKLYIRKTELSTITPTKNKEIIKSGNTAVDNWVNDNIGNINSFLLSCMLTQNSDKDFFTLEKKDQIKMLDKALHFESIQSLDLLLKESSLAYKDLINKTEAIYTHTVNSNNPVNREQLSTLESEYNQKCILIKQLEDNFNGIKETWHHIPDTDLNTPDEIIQTHINQYQQLVNQLVITETKDRLLQKKGALESELIELNKHVTNNDALCTNMKYAISQLESLESTIPTKPLYNQEQLSLELKQINSLKQKWIEFKVPTNLGEIDQINQNIIQDEQKLTDLIENKPNKPTKTLEQYQLWSSNYDLLINNIISTYGSIASLKSLCEQNPLIVPSIDQVTIDTLKTQLVKEKSKIVNPKWLDLNDTQFNHEYQILKNEFQDLQEKTNQINTHIIETEQNYELKHTLWNQLEEKLKKIRKYHIKEPKSTIDQCDQWLTKYNHLLPQKTNYTLLKKELSDFLDQEKNIRRQLEEQNQLKNKLEQEINTLNQNKYPFNPNCSACKQQPWKLHLDTLTKQHTTYLAAVGDLQLKLSQHIKDKDLISSQNKLNTVSKWLDDLGKMESDLEYWLDQKHQWEKYTPYLEQLNKTEQLIESSKQDWNTVNQQLKQLRLKKATNDIKIEKHKVIFESISYCQEYKSKWIQNEQIISEQSKIINNYFANKQAHDTLNCYISQLNIEQDWINELEAINAYHDWEKQKQDIEQRIKFNKDIYDQLSKLSIQVKEYESDLKMLQEKELFYNVNKVILNNWNDHHDQIWLIKLSINHMTTHQIEQQLSDLDQLTQFRSKLNYWTEIMQVKPLAIRKSFLYKTINNERPNMLLLEKKLDGLRTSQQEYQHRMTIGAKIECSIKSLKVIRDAIDHIIEIFKNYRTWLYTKFIIPKLLQKTNQIIASINDNTNVYQLMASVNPIKNEFSWFVNNCGGDTQIIIEKAGGFRRFIFGLAIRIAMSSLGASSVMCKQLFLDEGFCSADSDNLDKVPDFIKSLLCMYDSVLIVSHLDIIKECGDINAQIVKSAGSLSQMQFGKNTTNITTSVNVTKKITLKKKPITIKQH